MYDLQISSHPYVFCGLLLTLSKVYKNLKLKIDQFNLTMKGTSTWTPLTSWNIYFASCMLEHRLFFLESPIWVLTKFKHFFFSMESEEMNKMVAWAETLKVGLPSHLSPTIRLTFSYSRPQGNIWTKSLFVQKIHPRNKCFL